MVAERLVERKILQACSISTTDFDKVLVQILEKILACSEISCEQAPMAAKVSVAREARK